MGCYNLLKNFSIVTPAVTMTGQGQRKINTFFKPTETIDQSQRTAPKTMQNLAETNLAKKLHLLKRASQESSKPQNIMPLN